jgi:hypothetical protein
MKSGNVDISNIDGKYKKGTILPKIQFWWTVELISTIIFYILFFSIIATAVSQLLDVNHLGRKSSIKIKNLRLIANATLMLPHCKLYFKTMNNENDHIMAKENNAHVLPIDECLSSKSYMEEYEFVQILKLITENFSLCKIDQCQNYISWITQNILLILIVLCCLLIIIPKFFSKNEKRENLIIYSNNNSKKRK